MTTTPTITDPALLRLMTWLSPAFPVGGYSYSHGIEYAVEAGLIRDRDSLRRWLTDTLRFGAAGSDAILFAGAWRATAAEDDTALADVAFRADAFRATAEMHLESAAQGAAFLAGVAGAWPLPGQDDVRRVLAETGRPVGYAVAVGAIAALAELPLRTALAAFLHAFAANLVSAGVRLVPLGQSDGLRIIAALETEIIEAADRALAADPSQLATATWMVDWCSARHESQYTRLFRS